MEEINIKDFLTYLNKYTVLIIILAIFLGCIAVAYDKIYKTPMYTTYTTIVLVKNDKSNFNNTEAINQSDILVNQNLVSTYSQIIKSKLVLKQVINDLELDETIQTLSKNVNVQPLEDTEILKISVTNAKPDLAAKIANNIAKVFKNEITKIYKMNNVSIIDEAQINYKISNNTPKRDLVLAVLLAVFGTSTIIFIKFYFDDSVKFSENLETEIGMPIIAKILKDSNKNDLIVYKKPNSLTSESIRTLRTNLQFASVDKNLKTLLITSTIPSEGKSFISTNLAISFAQAGQKVLLIDCDLRKGRQHRIFKLNNKLGLSNLLISTTHSLRGYINKTFVENLSVMTRGVIPPNPSELLNSQKFSSLIDILYDKYDIIIFDGPPCNTLSDSLIISSLVDKVAIVSSENYTPKSELIATKDAIKKVGGDIVGDILNNITIKGHSYSKYYYYEEEEWLTSTHTFYMV